MKQPSVVLTIPEGEFYSDAVFVNAPFNAIRLPVGFEGASISFQRALGPRDEPPGSGNWSDLADASGNYVEMIASPESFVMMFSEIFKGIGWLRIVAAVPQTASREIILAGPLA